jgi:hypothetical protein
MIPKTSAKINPFLLPTCVVCGGPMNLSYVEPASESESERRVYRCSDCNAEQTVPSPQK